MRSTRRSHGSIVVEFESRIARHAGRGYVDARHGGCFGGDEFAVHGSAHAVGFGVGYSATPHFDVAETFCVDFHHFVHVLWLFGRWSSGAL